MARERTGKLWLYRAGGNGREEYIPPKSMEWLFEYGEWARTHKDEIVNLKLLDWEEALK